MHAYVIIYGSCSNIASLRWRKIIWANMHGWKISIRSQKIHFVIYFFLEYRFCVIEHCYINYITMFYIYCYSDYITSNTSNNIIVRRWITLSKAHQSWLPSKEYLYLCRQLFCYPNCSFLLSLSSKRCKAQW